MEGAIERANKTAQNLDGRFRRWTVRILIRLGIAEMNRPERANPPLLSRANVLGVGKRHRYRGRNSIERHAHSPESPRLRVHGRRGYDYRSAVGPLPEGGLECFFYDGTRWDALGMGCANAGIRQFQRVYGPD